MHSTVSFSVQTPGEKGGGEEGAAGEDGQQNTGTDAALVADCAAQVREYA